MTNREYINALTNEDFVNFCLFKMERLKYRWNNTALGLELWLDEPLEEEIFKESSFSVIN